MKKIFVLLFAVCFVLGMNGCKNEKQENGSDPETTAAFSVETTAESTSVADSGAADGQGNEETVSKETPTQETIMQSTNQTLQQPTNRMVTEAANSAGSSPQNGEAEETEMIDGTIIEANGTQLTIQDDEKGQYRVDTDKIPEEKLYRGLRVGDRVRLIFYYPVEETFPMGVPFPVSLQMLK